MVATVPPAAVAPAVADTTSRRMPATILGLAMSHSLIPHPPPHGAAPPWRRHLVRKNSLHARGPEFEQIGAPPPNRGPGTSTPTSAWVNWGACGQRVGRRTVGAGWFTRGLPRAGAVNRADDGGQEAEAAGVLRCAPTGSRTCCRSGGAIRNPGSERERQGASLRSISSHLLSPFRWEATVSVTMYR
jgi:hypothetical protein